MRSFRRAAGIAFYVLAGIATVYMYSGWALFIVRDIRSQGFITTMAERFWLQPPLGVAVQLLLWSLPGLILYAIGAWLRSAG
jgi:hypothetical protein